MTSNSLPEDYDCYQMYPVTLHLTYEKSYAVKAMSKNHAFEIAKHRAETRNAVLIQKGLVLIAVSVNETP